MPVNHPYTAQVIALWISFLPVFTIAVMMTAAAFRGDRDRSALVARERVLP